MGLDNFTNLEIGGLIAIGYSLYSPTKLLIDAIDCWIEKDGFKRGYKLAGIYVYIFGVRSAAKRLIRVVEKSIADQGVTVFDYGVLTALQDYSYIGFDMTVLDQECDCPKCVAKREEENGREKI